MQVSSTARSDAPAPAVTPIARVQGAGDASPLVGATIVVSGLVTGIQRTGAATGFYLQDPVGDGDARTSEGIVVRVGGSSTAWQQGLKLGARVTATGTVSERGGATGIDVASAVGVALGKRPGAAAITPQPLELPVDATKRAAYLEAREGMLVGLSDALVTGPSDAFGQFVAMDAKAQGMRRMGSLPDRTGYIHVDGRLGPKTPVMVGDHVTGIKGPLSSSGGNYAVMATGTFHELVRSAQPPRAFGDIDGDDRFTAADHAAVRSRIGQTSTGPLDAADLNGDGKISTADLTRLDARASRQNEAHGTRLTIATLNAENFFDPIDAPAPTRDDVPSRNAYLTKLAKLASTVRDTLGTPDLLALEEVENTKVLDDLLARPELAGLGYRYVLLPTNGARSINPALLYRTGAATVLGSSQLQQMVDGGEHAIYEGPAIVARSSAGPLFAREPLVVDLQLASGADGAKGRELTLIVNHLVSKFSPHGVPTDNMRVAQAAFLNAQVTRLRSEHPEREIVVLGDMNDTTASAALTALTGGVKTPTLVDATATMVPEAERYSFVYDGRSELIDHILVTPGLTGSIERAGVRHGNADLPVGNVWDSGPTRASDHDSPYIWLDLDAAGVPTPAGASPW